MFRNKAEIDKHVFGLLYKAKNENERNLRYFHVAKLYHKIQDYESVQRYISMYLNVRDDSAAAHKLLGQALEGLGQKDKAIASYTKSLKLDSDQTDLISKVCELLCDKDVEFDPVTARYWLERGSALFPHSLPVLTLKEKLLSVDSSSSSKDVEELLHAELKNKPTDIGIRIKLLKVYNESGRTEMAINHAFEVESRLAHVNCSAWYKCLHSIYWSYNRDHFAKCTWEFYVQWLTALDRMCLLSIAENTGALCDYNEALNCVYNFDQALYSAHLSATKTEKYSDFLKMMSTQLAYLMGVLLLKKAKKENSHWKEMRWLVGPLFLFASNLPLKLDHWISTLSEPQQKVLGFWLNQVHSRQVQAGHFLLCLVKENGSEKMFLDKVSHFFGSDWKRSVWEKTFSLVSDSKQSSSHLMTSTDFNKLPLKVPSSNYLKPTTFVAHFESTYYGSLHYLVWLGLRSTKKNNGVDLKLHSFQTTGFKSLKFTINNLNNIGVETINQLDVDSFLYTTVYCAAAILEESRNLGGSDGDRPEILPADITPSLCTPEQAKWWSNLCSLVKGGRQDFGSNETMSDVRFSLQRGLEVIRGEGLPPLLIVALARTFSDRVSEANSAEESDGCSARALHLWKVAYPTLERLASNKPHFTAKMNPMFEYPAKNLSSQAAKSMFEEARSFIGCHYLKMGQYEKAVEELKGIKSPQALYHLAIVYQRWAEQQTDGLRAGEMTSSTQSRCSLLLTKSKDFLLEAKSIIRNEPKNPLQGDVEAQILEVNDLLAGIEIENGAGDEGLNGNGGHGSTSSDSTYSPEIVPIMNTTNPPRASRHHHQTSTPQRAYESRMKLAPYNTAEIIDLLSVQHQTSQLRMQEVLGQIKIIVEKIDSLATEQRAQRNLMEGFVTRLETEIRSSVSDIKKDIKKPDFNNMFDDEDYDEMLQYQGYQQYYAPGQRGLVQNAAAAAAAAAAPPPAPAVPYMNQYFSPRIDPLCQSFYSQQGALPFSEGQQLPDFLRQQKVGQPLLHSLPAGLPAQLNLSAAAAASAVPGSSRVPVTALPPPTGVLLSTTDNLTPSVVHPPPPLTVNIPTSQKSSLPLPPSTSPAVVAPHNFQIPLPAQPKPPPLNIEERPADEETPLRTYDPMPDYKPLVPLPDEIEVHTGEEDEEILFERRAKLYRYVDHMWKDRGVGNLKVLKNKNTGKVRILMRRDQVHKICANHLLTPDMKLSRKSDSESAWIWGANDFADEKIQFEQFCAKFKTKEDGDEFKAVFDQAKGQEEPLKNDSINKSPVVSTVSDSKTSSGIGFGFGSTHISGSTPCFSTSSTFSIGQPFVSLTSQISESKSPVVTSNLKPQPDVTGTQFTPVVFGASNPPQVKIGDGKLISSADPSVGTTWGLRTSTNSGTTEAKSSPTTWGFRTPPTANERKPQVIPPALSSPTETSPPPSTAASTKVGGFTFALAQPKFKPPELIKAVGDSTAKEPSPFSKFNFGITSSETSKSIFSDFSSLPSQSKTEMPNPFAINKSPKPTPVTSSQTEPVKEKVNEPDSPTPKDESESTDFIPTATFKPVIPLPDLIAVKTGEENEEIVYEERAQLFRFCRDTKAWKERGTGQIKILLHPETGVYRLLMRREQVLKVCCNHRITPDITLKPLSSSDKVWSWPAKDYSEDTPTDELFSLKFKKVEQAIKFKEEYEKAQAVLRSRPNQPVAGAKTASSQPSLASLVKKPPGSWDCKSCYVQNKSDASSCLACSSPREGASQPQAKPLSQAMPPPQSKPTSEKSLAELLKPKPGSWECGECYVRNQPEAESCLSCGKPKPGTVPKAAEAAKQPVMFSFGIPQGAESQTGPSFGAKAFNFGASSISQKPATSIFDLKSSADTSPAPFTFGGGFSIGTSSAPQLSDDSSTSLAKTGFVFSSPSQTAPGSSTNSFGSKTFQFEMPPVTVAPTSPGASSQHDESGYDPEEEESHVQFQPVVPLPDKVDVMTGEENENVLYSHRAKLYRFEASTKEWKERGLGDVKILQHKETGKIRFLMRREPVMKVCLNHLIKEDLELLAKDDKSWIWYAIDFSEGAQVNENFAIKFKSPDIARTFKEEVEKAKLLVGKPPSVEAPSHGEKPADAPRPSGCDSDSDVEFVSEIKPTPELEAKAKSLLLPPTFYNYLDKPDCPGCRGCQNDDTDEDRVNSATINVTPKKKKEIGQFSKNIFSNVVTAPGNPDSSKSTGFTFGQAFMTPQSDESTEKKDNDLFSRNIFGNLGSAPGSTDSTPKSAGFTFGQAFTTPKSDPKILGDGQKGFLFNQTSFSTVTPQKNNIFSTGVSSESPSYLSETEKMQSFGALSSGENSFALAAENFKWDGAGNQVFGSFQMDLKKKPFPLPGKAFKATEEECDILFHDKGTLYKSPSDGEEAKKVGTGELKLLKHKTQKITFVFLRAEPDNKIICCCALNKDFALVPGEDCKWKAVDHSEPKPSSQYISVEFQNPGSSSNFKSTVEKYLN